MLMHLLKPIWKRKSRNFMLSLELLLAFVIVFAVAVFAVRYYQLYRMPVGFAHQDVWSVEIEFPEGDANSSSAGMFERFTRDLNALPEVEQVSFGSYSPYVRSMWTSEFYLPESLVAQRSNVMAVSDGFFDTLGMAVEQGRWFDARDAGATETPVVINRELASKLFPNQDPLGKLIRQGNEEDAKSMRVTGVFNTFRNQGEFMSPTPFIFTRFAGKDDEPLLRNILIRLQPGTARMFEAKLNQQLKLIRNNWGYRIAPLSSMRLDMLSTSLIPIIVLAVIASFLLLMVAFGLFGVLWQNTTQRIPEIGLRRAVGASARWIYAQIILEQLILSALAMSVGFLLLVQLPITGTFGEELNWVVFSSAISISVLLLLLLSVLCALYPAWRASRLTPTEALRYA
jgi:putative ABC transport system permease protein